MKNPYLTSYFMLNQVLEDNPTKIYSGSLQTLLSIPLIIIIRLKLNNTKMYGFSEDYFLCDKIYRYFAQK